jgi:hypothetical protein
MSATVIPFGRRRRAAEGDRPKVSRRCRVRALKGGWRSRAAYVAARAPRLEDRDFAMALLRGGREPTRSQLDRLEDILGGCG